MTDNNNAGQFGNRADTQKQAKAGGKATGTNQTNSDRTTSQPQTGNNTNLTDADRAKGGRNSHIDTDS